MTATVEIEIQNVGMSFGSEVVLEDISLQILKGEKLVLMGPSGEGKSLLLKIMAGILTPTKGRVMVQGKELSTLSIKEREKLVHKMGMLFQKNALFDSLTVGENIAFPLRETTDLSENEISERVDFFLEGVAIPHAKDLFPDEISGGMQKRLGIARALALKPEIVFYDDPTAGLDPITSRRIIDLILQLQQENNATVVTITNDMNRAFQMADRMAMVVDQSIIITGNVEETQKFDDQRVQQFIYGALEGPLTVMG